MRTTSIVLLLTAILFVGLQLIPQANASRVRVRYTRISPKPIVSVKDFIAELFQRKPYFIYKIKVPFAYRRHARHYVRSVRAALRKVFGKRRIYLKRWYTKRNELKLRRYLALYLKKSPAKPWYKRIKARKSYYRTKYLRKAGFRRRGRKAPKKHSFSRSKPYVYKYSGRRGRKRQTEIYQITVPAGYRYKKNAYRKCAKSCWKRVFGKALRKGYRKNVFYAKINLYEKCVKKCLKQKGIKPKKIVNRKDFITKLFRKKPKKISKIQVPAKYRKYAGNYIRSFKRALARVSGKRRYYPRRCYTKRKEAKFRKYLTLYLRQMTSSPWYRPCYIFEEPVYYFFGKIKNS